MSWVHSRNDLDPPLAPALYPNRKSPVASSSSCRNACNPSLFGLAADATDDKAEIAPGNPESQMG